jgi:hypothetical protein
LLCGLSRAGPVHDELIQTSASVDEIAAYVAFPLSDESCVITGAALAIDGGAPRLSTIRATGEECRRYRTHRLAVVPVLRTVAHERPGGALGNEAGRARGAKRKPRFGRIAIEPEVSAGSRGRPAWMTSEPPDGPRETTLGSRSS